ncbi:hypothetical protein GN244_ATG14279 [Phytophthora infestans]|uniref:Uncharacterized protein n=1 Tax=Phytophthora infestans TaxID=4787 RepID=A0A833S5T9_PHYIN|nr:hypothetical protein GN244_ATG14279 [Phytophthora infestans]KAF4130052.1 hypothetical protein GN958_ATG20766 [Phytophthora infestans]
MRMPPSVTKIRAAILAPVIQSPQSLDVIEQSNRALRHGTGAGATSVEEGRKVWYDISTLPSGTTDGNSYKSCTTKTGKYGSNVGETIEPISPYDDTTFACCSLLCQYGECPDSFRFPSDESKIKNSQSTNF